MLKSLWDIIVFLFWDNLTYTVIVLIFGWLLMVLWKRAQTRAEQGLNGLWHLLFSWVYFFLEVLTAIALIAIVTRGSVLLYTYTRDQLHKGAADAAKAGGFEVTSTPGPLTIQGTPFSTLPPFGSTPTSLATPQSSTQNLAGVADNVYVVSDPTGATVRVECSSEADELGSLPLGAQVVITSVVDSNCVSGICQRGVISPLSGFPNGGCLHMAAVSKR